MKRCVVVILLSIVLAYPQIEAWISRYAGYGPSGARDIAVDNAGNVYVAGWGAYPDRSRDCMTIKYNNAGDTLWVRYYDGGADFYDDVYALAIDDAGNVYVTGQCMVLSGNRDIVTIKYNSAGVEQWVAIYAGAYGDDDEGHDIAVDDSGYVYVTGFTYSLSTSTDWMTIKYDDNGDTVWTASYNNPDSSADQATAIALDGLGNVYVTGYAIAGNEWYNYTTIKYNAAGEQQWLASYDGFASYADDIAYDIEYHGGYIYVTGGSENANNDVDYLTIKYDSSGDTVWTARYDGPGGSDDEALALAVDNNGNVYIAGESFGLNTANDYATIKYTTTGTWEWTSRYNGPDSVGDEANAIAVDDMGNVYVTGRSYAYGTYTPEFDYLTVKYDASGTEQWNARYDGTGHTQDEAHAVTVDNAGYVYVTGQNIGTTSYEDVVTIKYTVTGITEDPGFLIHDTRCNLTASPNPFSKLTKIRYSILDSGYWIQNPTLRVYDACGRLVKSLNEVSSIENQESSIIWNGRDDHDRQLASGVYFVRLEAGNFQEISRILLVR